RAALDVHPACMATRDMFAVRSGRPFGSYLHGLLSAAPRDKILFMNPLRESASGAGELSGAAAWGARRRVGPYRVIRMIGRGGMGEVYAAEHVRAPTARVALKRLRAELVTDVRFVELFEHEASVHALV